MAKDRITPCIYYECAGTCQKGRKAEHYGYCQHCDLYRPRANVKYLNTKKKKLQKLKNNERFQDGG